MSGLSSWSVEIVDCPFLQGNVLLLSMQNRFGIVALHFTAAIPRLDAHLLPLEMPKQLEEVGDEIVAMAWDKRGERLAVALNTGILAILSTKWSPLLSVSLVGMISGPRSRYAKILVLCLVWNHLCTLKPCYCTAVFSGKTVWRIQVMTWLSISHSTAASKAVPS